MKRTGKEETGNTDERERARELTEAEQRRLQRFEALSEELVRQGFTRTELTVSIVRANIFALILLIPLFVVGFGAFFLIDRQVPGTGSLHPVLFLAVLMVLIVVHELIHGICWAVFAEHHFRDIEFGFMKQYLTPYCTCCVPLTKGQYIFGSLMPFVLLGLLPMLAGIFTGSMTVLLMGIIMADSAAGDILIVRNILRYRSTADTVLYIDHPTQAGGVIFEKTAQGVQKEEV